MGNKKTTFGPEILTRAVEEVIVREHLEAELRSGRKLRVKFGIDPTSPRLHLGHTVPLRKLRAFQDLGHKAVLIIGDFTATVGDPSGRSEARRPFTEKEIRQNMKSYLEQAGKIIDLKKTEVRYNGEWYKKAGAAFIYDLLSKVTLQRATERDDFQKRIQEGRDISVLEIIYPLLQGYDSVAVRADVEIGGSDQKFNLLMGRKIQRRYGMKEQNILTTWLIEGTDGVRKMSKSFANSTDLKDPPPEMFGKIMSIPDTLIVKYMTALTATSQEEIEEVRNAIKLGKINPRDAKLLLAEKVTAIYWGPAKAERARNSFLKVFSRHELPEDVPSVKLGGGPQDFADFLVRAKLAPSRSEARRLIQQKAVKIDGVVLPPETKSVDIKNGMVIQAGKRKFVKIRSV